MNMLATETPAIFEGQGATIVNGDQHIAGTIVEVTDKAIVVREDIATTTHGAPRGVQVYDYDRNPSGEEHVYTLRADGAWKLKGATKGSLTIGSRRTFHP